MRVNGLKNQDETRVVGCNVRIIDMKGMTHSHGWAGPLDEGAYSSSEPYSEDVSPAEFMNKMKAKHLKCVIYGVYRPRTSNDVFYPRHCPMTIKTLVIGQRLLITRYDDLLLLLSFNQTSHNFSSNVLLMLSYEIFSPLQLMLHIRLLTISSFSVIVDTKCFLVFELNQCVDFMGHSRVKIVIHG